MTETRAAYEAATLEAMHTGDWSALAAYARTVADVDGEPEPPARHVDGDDYTWAGPSYPAAPVLAEDNAALREQITQLHCDYSGQIATLELRVRELESERLSLNEAIAVADKLNAVQRVKELEAQLGVAVVARTSVAPDWSTAPHWANWWAMDGDGTAWWYEDEPIPSRRYARWIVNGDGRNCAASNTNWRSTLVARPQAVQP